jgi:hypothetical protein
MIHCQSQQENINIDTLGTFSSHRLDLDLSLSEAASESMMTAIFRDHILVGDNCSQQQQLQHCSIRLANPIKEGTSSSCSYDQLELASLCESNMMPLPTSSSSPSLFVPSRYNQEYTNHLASRDHAAKPLGCSYNHAHSNSNTNTNNSLQSTFRPHNNSGLASSFPPMIDFTRYFQDYSSDECEPASLMGCEDDFSVSSVEVHSITSYDDDDDLMGLNPATFVWTSSIDEDD